MVGEDAAGPDPDPRPAGRAGAGAGPRPRQARDRFEAKGAAFHERLRAGLPGHRRRRARPLRRDRRRRRRRGRGGGDLGGGRGPAAGGGCADGAAPSARRLRPARARKAAEAAFLRRCERGRLHHAWLLTGPEGVGKATFAYRAARRLLGAPARPGSRPAGLRSRRSGQPPGHRPARTPTCWCWSARPTTARPAQVIPVDEARKLPEFFSKSPASAPYRVAIIDAADDLNVNAANAVLKTLEEPPPRGRAAAGHPCAGPAAAAPSARAAAGWPSSAWDLEARRRLRRASAPDVADEDALRLAEMAEGAPGRALQLAAGGRARRWTTRPARCCASCRSTDEAAAAGAGRQVPRRRRARQRFDLLFERLADRVHG